MERNSVITRKGQVTLPADIRRALGLKEGDRVSFRMNDGKVIVVPVGSVAASTAGIFRTRRRAPSVKALREMAEEAFVEEAKS